MSRIQNSQLSTFNSQLIPPGYKQTEVGVIPEDWVAIPLGAATSEIGDGIHATPIYSSIGEYYFINGNNLRGGQIVITEETKAIDHSEFKKNQKNIGDRSILMSINGTIGSLGLFAGEPVVIGKSVAYLNVKDSVSKLFVYHSIQTEPVKRQFIDGLTGTTIRNLGLGTIRATTIAFPPTLAEQQAIAEALSDADALIESLEQLLAKKRHIKQGAMQELLTSKKRLPGFGGEWEVVKAGDIGRFRGGSGFPTKFQGASSGAYPFFKVSDMNNEGNEMFMEVANNYISETLRKQLGATAFPAKSIVFAKVGAAVFLERKKILAKASCLDNNMAAFMLDSVRADCRYIHYVLLNTKMSDLVSTTALPSISGSVLAAIELMLPPLPEQTAIAAILSDMDAEIAALEAKLAKARQIKQGMMRELLTGRMRLV